LFSDQQAVLQRPEHVVDGLVFSVRGSPEPLTSSRDQDYAAAPLPVGSALSLYVGKMRAHTRDAPDFSERVNVTCTFSSTDYISQVII